MLTSYQEKVKLLMILKYGSLELAFLSDAKFDKTETIILRDYLSIKVHQSNSKIYYPEENNE